MSASYDVTHEVIVILLTQRKDFMAGLRTCYLVPKDERHSNRQEYLWLNCTLHMNSKVKCTKLMFIPFSHCLLHKKKSSRNTDDRRSLLPAHFKGLLGTPISFESRTLKRNNNGTIEL
jgi:hypothetical protein